MLDHLAKAWALPPVSSSTLGLWLNCVLVLSKCHLALLSFSKAEWEVYRVPQILSPALPVGQKVLAELVVAPGSGARCHTPSALPSSSDC